MAYLSEFEYYTNNATAPEDKNLGSYQYISLDDIVTNFMLMYYGNHSVINNEPRYKVLFHAKRGIQELNYDAFKEIKILELIVPNTLKFVLPHDYVNWVRISVYDNGVLRPLSENIQTNWSSAYLQDNNGSILFDVNGNILSPQFSAIDRERIAGSKKSIYLNSNNPLFNGYEGYNYNGDWYFDYKIGARFGLNTETANANPTFKLDKKAGVINFSSGMSDKLCILEYVSDGMEGGDATLINANKLFESYLYAYIEFEILSSKLGVQEYVIRRARKKMRALRSNAKIRISDIHPGRLLMNMRGRDKIIK